jgi:phosphatidylglycerophosphate synthase
MNPALSLQSILPSWSTANAVALLLAGLAVIAGLPLLTLSACASISFALLAYRCRGRWTPVGRFGAANAVTFARLGGILCLPWLEPLALACTALLLFALDGADGCIARRTGLASEFGEFADKESDALLVLMLCAVLYRLPDGFGAWILAPGALRYVFVLFVACARPPARREPRTALAGWISTLMILSLILCLATYPAYLAHTSAIIAVMALLLFCSFAASTYRMYCVTGAQRD